MYDPENPGYERSLASPREDFVRYDPADPLAQADGMPPPPPSAPPPPPPQTPPGAFVWLPRSALPPLPALVRGGGEKGQSSRGAGEPSANTAAAGATTVIDMNEQRQAAARIMGQPCSEMVEGWGTRCSIRRHLFYLDGKIPRWPMTRSDWEPVLAAYMLWFGVPRGDRLAFLCEFVWRFRHAEATLPAEFAAWLDRLLADELLQLVSRGPDAAVPALARAAEPWRGDGARTAGR
jgi:hypothetical protein